MPGPSTISYTPPVPDGPDCPWIRGRRTRWWLVIPADLIAVGFIAALAGAGMHDTAQIPQLLASGGASLLLAWASAWVITRPQDHLEVMNRSGWVVVALTWVEWVCCQGALGEIKSFGALTSFAAMMAAFLVIGLGGWRWLYGFAKAQESVTPRAIARKMAAQNSGEDTDCRQPAASTHQG